MGKPFISQNITLATGGFTYENGILTPAEAKLFIILMYHQMY